MSGFYQVPLSADSIEKTGFVTPDGHFEFLRVPFGLTNAPAVFQRLMNLVLGDSALVYIDDVIIASKTIAEGLLKLKDVLERLRKHKLTLKLSKCSFFESQIEYLGREISEEGVRPGSSKIVAIKNMPTPSTQKKVRQFLGLASYFRKFVRNFAYITEPLTRLLKKDCVWYWGEEQDKAVATIKRILIDRPVLSIFNPALKTEVHSDACKISVAGILIQIDENNTKHVVA